MGERKGFQGKGGKALLALSLFLLLLFPADGLSLPPLERLVAPFRFSLPAWEVRNAPAKWLHKARGLLLPSRPSPQEGRALISRFFQMGEELRRLEGEIKRLSALRGNPSSGGRLALLEEKRRDLLRQRAQIAPLVEEALEAELSTLFREEDLLHRWGPFRALFPPVDFRFGQPPKVLALSPRERIHLQGTVLLRADLSLSQVERLEEEILREFNLSALVEDLGGVATYPSFVAEGYDLRTVLRIVAHEWLHQYLFFTPLGRNIFSSPEMHTLNETLADLAGNELGDLAFLRLGGRLPPKTSEGEAEAKAEEGFDFRQEMRKTRLRVEELLAQGRVEEAERYMEERRRFFVAHGHYIRKLNQAYFAFHGAYADSPASLSPIAGQLREVRRRFPSVGAFVRALARFGSYQEFLEFFQGLPASPSPGARPPGPGGPGPGR